MAEERMEVCKNCGKIHNKRVDLEIVVDKKELDLIKLIIEKANCSNQLMKNLYTIIPSNADQDIINKIVSAIIEKQSEIQFMEQDWWSRQIKEYKLVGEVYVDFSTGRFYYFEE